MRIGVIGAGAIGGTLAVLLRGAGHEVAVTARGAHRERIAAAGLRLTGGFGDHHETVAADERLAFAPELTLVCVKTPDTADALEANRERLTAGPIVMVQNGLSALETAQAALPRADVYGGLAIFAAMIAGPGEIRVTAPGDLYVGRGDGPASPEAERIAEVLGAALPTRAVPDFLGCQWTKLIINQVNALPAITGSSVQQTAADPRLRRILTASMQEAVRVGLTAGVHYGSLQGLGHGLLRLVAAAPAPMAAWLPRIMARRMGATPNLGSTLQSLLRGRPTEVDELNGAIVATARRHGGTAPVNAALTALVHAVEADRRPREPDELAAMPELRARR